MVGVIGGTHQTSTAFPVMLIPLRTTVPDCAAAKDQKQLLCCIYCLQVFYFS